MKETATTKWARETLLRELHALRGCGRACNVQDWADVGIKANVAECAAKRRAARRLLDAAIRAVETAR